MKKIVFLTFLALNWGLGHASEKEKKDEATHKFALALAEAVGVLHSSYYDSISKALKASLPVTYQEKKKLVFSPVGYAKLIEINKVGTCRVSSFADYSKVFFDISTGSDSRRVAVNDILIPSRTWNYNASEMRNIFSRGEVVNIFYNSSPYPADFIFATEAKAEEFRVVAENYVEKCGM